MSPKEVILAVVVLGLIAKSECVTSINLISEPSPVGRQFCDLESVNFTCIGNDIATAFSWMLNDTTLTSYIFQRTHAYPFPLVISIPGVTILVDNATQSEVVNSINLFSTLTVDRVSTLNGSSLQCTDNLGRTATIDTTSVSLDKPPTPSTELNCSIQPSPEDSQLTVHFNNTFNALYGVERYNVTVTSDPSSCSSDQVSPREDYSCSGLDPMTNYTITVSAINCGDQEGMISTSFLYFNAPPAVNFALSQEDLNVIHWMEQQGSNICAIPVTYTVEVLGENGEVVRTLSVSSSNCSDGNCSVIFPVSEQYVCVSIMTNNTLGASSEVLAIASSKLNSTNRALLGLGVFIIISILILIILLTFKVFTIKGSIPSLILLCIGCVMFLLSVIMWIVVAIYVGQQDNICDFSWRRTKNDLIICSHVLSDLTFLVFLAFLPFLRKHEEKISTGKMEQNHRPASGTDWVDMFALNSQRHLTAMSEILNSLHVCKSMVGVDHPMQWFSKERQWPITHLSQESKLNVYFMSKCPEQWKYSQKVITSECIMNILDSSWQECFTITQNPEDSHVRVAFQENESNWSKIGFFATKEPKNSPTMNLNFCELPDKHIKATILHQFGHALGLGHALIKPDDWNHLQSHLNAELTNKLIERYGFRTESDFITCDEASRYDDKSIMKFSISRSWLSYLKNKEKVKILLILNTELSTEDQQTFRTFLDGRQPIHVLLEKDAQSLHELAPVWKDMASKLGLHTKNIGNKFREEDRLTEVFSMWRSKELKYPFTWKGLGDLLEDCSKLKEATKLFENFLV